MNLEKQMAVLIQKYLKEERNQTYTIEEILSRPRWKRVWFYWKALEKFEGKNMPELTVEEVEKIYGDK